MSIKLDLAKKFLVAALDEGEAVTLRNWQEIAGTVVEKGGTGSGHFGHAGRLGKVGGSLPGLARGIPGNLDAILTKQGELTGIEWQQIAYARGEYATYYEQLYDIEPGTIYEAAVDSAARRNKRLAGTETMEESLAMSIRREIEKSTGMYRGGLVAPDVRDIVMDNIVDEADVTIEDARGYVAGWNISSWEHESSAALQRVAWEKSEREDLPTKAMADIVGEIQHTLKQDNDVFDYVYNETQAMFKAAGVNTVTVYRGIQLAKQNHPEMAAVDSGVVEFRQGPLSSWSFDPFMAMCFGNCAMSMEVPVERIWSTGLTGPGTVGEFEAIVLEDIGDDEVSFKWQK